MNSIKNATLLLLISTVLVACGGGGGGSTSVETSDLTANFISPEADSSNVERNPFISVYFDGEILPTSANNNALLLRRDDEWITGTVSMPDTDMVTLTPDNELDLLTVYHPSFTTEIADLQGRPLSASKTFEWSFETRDGNWGETKNIATGAGIKNPLAIAEGVEISLLYQSDNDVASGQNDLFYIHQPLADGSPQTRKLVSNSINDGEVIGALNVKRLSTGDLLAVWREKAANNTNEIWYNRYNHANKTWNKSASVILDDNHQSLPSLVSNASGDVFLLFSARTAGTTVRTLNVISYSTADDHWQEAQLLSDDVETSLGNIQASIAIDSAGNMMAVWFNSNYRVSSRYYNATSGLWEEVQEFSAPNAGNTDKGIQIIVDAQNNFTVAWSQKDIDFAPYIWINRYTADEGWNGAQRINSSSYSGQPVIQADKDGNLMLLCIKEAIVGQRDLLFSRYNVTDATWTSATLLEKSDYPVSQPSLLVDRSGNFMAMWNQNRTFGWDIPTVWVRRFDNTGDGEWKPESAITAVDGAVDSPFMAVNSSGEIMAIWMQDVDSLNTLLGRYFD